MVKMYRHAMPQVSEKKKREKKLHYEHAHKSSTWPTTTPSTPTQCPPSLFHLCSIPSTRFSPPPHNPALTQPSQHHIAHYSHHSPRPHPLMSCIMLPMHSPCMSIFHSPLFSHSRLFSHSPLFSLALLLLPRCNLQ